LPPSSAAFWRDKAIGPALTAGRLARAFPAEERVHTSAVRGLAEQSQQDFGKTISGENSNEINASKPAGPAAARSFPVKADHVCAARPLDIIRIPD